MAAWEWSRFASSSVLLIAAAGLSMASSASGSALHAGSGMRVGCGEAVGVARIAESSLQTGIEVFVGNGGSLVAANADDGLLWVKVGVGIVPRHAITIRMLSPRPGQGGMLWGYGTGGPQGLVHFAVCRGDDAYPPVRRPNGFAYAGGFVVRGASCVRLQVTGSGYTDLVGFSSRARRSDPAPRCP